MKLEAYKLPHTLIKITGDDCKNFLQGLITQNITLANMVDATHSNSIYSLLLNHKGRYMFDFFVISIYENDKEAFLIDIHNDLATNFISKLNFYKLRSKVTISITTLLSFALYPQNSLSYTPNLALFNHGNTLTINNHIIIQDVRNANLGLKVITSKLDTKFINKFLSLDDLTTTNHATTYTILRYNLTIPQYNDLLQEKSIPIECGFDEINTLCYNKGCYLGQEFTNSVKRTLEIRKRLITFKSLETIDDTNETNLTILDSNQENIGNVYNVFNHPNPNNPIKSYILALVKIKPIINSPQADYFINNSKVLPSIAPWIKEFSLN